MNEATPSLRSSVFPPCTYRCHDGGSCLRNYRLTFFFCKLRASSLYLNRGGAAMSCCYAATFTFLQAVA